MMLIGIDDTDSISGMCTTYIASLLARKLNLKKLPLLIRLNPNIPYKTRGNGAIALETDDPSSRENIISLVKDISMFGEPGTNPGIVFLESKRAPKVIQEFYSRAVSELVQIDDAKKAIESVGADSFHLGNGRGLIGALAAIGFTGEKTYEMIAYRESQNYAKPRKMSHKSICDMDEKLYPKVFDNLAPDGKKPLIMPRGNDPVLYGIRGISSTVVEQASDLVIAEEPIEMKQVFETNQATDAHLRPKNIRDIMPYDCLIVKGTVIRAPQSLEGGHTVFSLSDGTKEIDCAAFKPTGSFRISASHLIPGDLISVCGGIGKYVNTINMEKFTLLKAKDQICYLKPKCCGKAMTSSGRDKGFKCRICGKKSKKALQAETIPRKISPGTYEVDPGSRRHLSKPLILSHTNKSRS